MKDRIELAEHFAKLGFKKGAEVGTASGRYAEILCQKIPDLEYLGVDVWGKYEGNWRSNKYQEGAYIQARDRLKDYPKVWLFRNTSLVASTVVDDNSLDFVFIDGSHLFNNVMLDILLWTPKIRSGGIVSGHDYYNFHNSGVIQAVDLYTTMNNIKLEIIPSKPDGFIDDRHACWYFYKK